MKLFEKHYCFNCGQSAGTFPKEYGQKPERKYLCENCQDKMHIRGFEDYRMDISKFNRDFNMSMAYSEYYNRIINDESNYVFNEEFTERLTLEIGRLVLNKNFISVGGYKDLLIDTSDVIAVIIEKDYKYSGTFHEGLCVTVFTNNPLVPHVSGFVTGRVKLFSFSLKAKELRQQITGWFVENCPNLRYGVSTAAQLKKEIKQDNGYNGGYSKKEIVYVLNDASTNSGCFKAKNIIKAAEFNPIVHKINLDMGYAVYNEKAKDFAFLNKRPY